MKKYILFLTLILSSEAYSFNITEEFFEGKENIKESELSTYQIDFINSRFKFFTEKCGTKKEYFDFITLGFLIQGVYVQEHYSEIAGKAAKLCPLKVIDALDSHHGEPSSSFVYLLGIRLPPWEIGEAIYPIVTSKKYERIYNLYFKAWLKSCVSDKGKAIIGCSK